MVRPSRRARLQFHTHQDWAGPLLVRAQCFGEESVLYLSVISPMRLPPRAALANEFCNLAVFSRGSELAACNTLEPASAKTHRLRLRLARRNDFSTSLLMRRSRASICVGTLRFHRC